jgi:putative glycosyltransferase
MSKRYVSNLVEHKEKEVFLAGLFEITGFKQISIKVNKDCKSNSAYTLKRKVSMAINGITSFSYQPLVIIFYLGITISLSSVIAALVLIVRKIFFDEYLMGWPSLVVSVWFLGGVTIFCLGIIGIYLSKIYMETKNRPYTVIRQIYDGKKN